MVAALVAGGSAFRAQRDSIRVWAPVFVGAAALLMAIGFGTSEKILTLYPLDSSDSRGRPVGSLGRLR